MSLSTSSSSLPLPYHPASFLPFCLSSFILLSLIIASFACDVLLLHPSLSSLPRCPYSLRPYVAYSRQMYKDKTGSIRDPLDVAREQNGLPSVKA